MVLLGSIVVRVTKRTFGPSSSILAIDPGEFGPGTCRLGHKGCVACRKADKSGNTNFCTSCEVSVMQNAPAIIEIAEENETFKSGLFCRFHDPSSRSLKIREQSLNSSSVRGGTPPRVRKFAPSTRSWQRNRTWTNTTRTGTSSSSLNAKGPPLTVPNFSDSVEARGHFTGVNRPPGNENRRWHGTRRKCTLGDNGCTTFCSDSQCSLCCIINTSFDLAHFGKKTSWGRFGAGIYTSSTSSKFVSPFPTEAFC